MQLWQEDYPPVVENGPQSAEELQIPDAAAPVATDVPTSVPISSVADAPEAPVQTSVSTPTAISSAGLIEIQTDTLQLTIDLNGGDIVELALPQYLKQLDVTDDPFEVLESGPARNYVAQSGLIGANGIDSAGRAIFSSNASAYEMADNEDTLTVDLTAEATQPGITVVKRFTFTRNSYLVDVSYLVENGSSDTWQANAFGQIKRDSFDDPSSSGGFGQTFLGFVATSEDDPYIKIDFDDIDDAAQTIEMSGGWIGFSQHYFLTAWIPTAESTNRFTTRKNDINQYFGEFTSAAFVVAPGTSGSHAVRK